MNTYTVSFALDYLVISTTIMGMCEEVAPDMARDQIMQDYPEVFPLLEQAFEVDVVLLDSDVLGSGGVVITVTVMAPAIRWANAEESGTLLIDDNCDVARLFSAMLSDADTWHFTQIPVFTKES